MSLKSESSDGEQFRLDLDQPEVQPTVATIVSFIDAETRALRASAIERVRSSGIFEAPKVIYR